MPGSFKRSTFNSNMTLASVALITRCVACPATGCSSAHSHPSLNRVARYQESPVSARVRRSDKFQRRRIEPGGALIDAGFKQRVASALLLRERERERFDPLAEASLKWLPHGN